MRLQEIGSFVLGVAVASATYPQLVTADRVQMHGSVCAPEGSTLQYNISSPPGVYNESTTADLQLVCPVPTSQEDSDDNFNHVDTTSISIRVYDGNNDTSGGSVSAQACITYYNSTSGGSCGSTATTSSSGTGYATLSPSAAVWTGASAGHYPALRVVLPNKDGLAVSSVIGYTVVSP